MHEEFFDIMEDEFEKKYNYELHTKKIKMVHGVTKYEFFDFSPRVFHLIRKMYGISAEIYLKSVGPENLIGNLVMGNICSLSE
jgi:1-phosphatidylinositol-4-phosphate 5-kinase